jgi:hypothetical protein
MGLRGGKISLLKDPMRWSTASLTIEKPEFANSWTFRERDWVRGVLRSAKRYIRVKKRFIVSGLRFIWKGLCMRKESWSKGTCLGKTGLCPPKHVFSLTKATKVSPRWSTLFPLSANPDGRNRIRKGWQTLPRNIRSTHKQMMFPIPSPFRKVKWSLRFKTDLTSWPAESTN